MEVDWVLLWAIFSSCVLFPVLVGFLVFRNDNHNLFVENRFLKSDRDYYKSIADVREKSSIFLSDRNSKLSDRLIEMSVEIKGLRENQKSPEGDNWQLGFPNPRIL